MKLRMVGNRRRHLGGATASPHVSQTMDERSESVKFV